MTKSLSKIVRALAVLILAFPSISMAEGLGSCGSKWYESLIIPDIICFDVTGGELWYKSCSTIAKKLKVQYKEVNFSTRCNQHDNCYDSSTKKSACDTEFKKNLYKSCETALYTWVKSLNSCKKDADKAYDKVKGTSGKACEAYKKAKVKHKDCN